jgi:hypothetical protein
LQISFRLQLRGSDGIAPSSLIATAGRDATRFFYVSYLAAIIDSLYGME